MAYRGLESHWDSRAWDDGAQELGAGVEIEGTETAAERVEEDEAGGVNLEDQGHVVSMRVEMPRTARADNPVLFSISLLSLRRTAKSLSTL